MRVMEWLALEYKEGGRPAAWFWLVGGVTLVLIAASILWGNFLLAILLLFGGATLLLLGKRPPRTIRCGVLDEGVRFGDRLFHYHALKSFCVIEDERRGRRLVVESKKIFLPHVHLPLGENVSGAQLRQQLSARLPEVHHEETFADALHDWLGF